MQVSESVKDICKLGTGKTCCKYLSFSEGGFSCLKIDQNLKVIIDNKSMHAEGDNCEGLIDLTK